jgi:hypothetical protein
LEPWANLGTPLLADLIMGLNDSLPILFMGVLLGLIFKGNMKGYTHKRKIQYHFVFITISYIVGRYFLYFFVKIDSGYIARPMETFIWTLIMGIWIGIIYQTLFVGITVIDRRKKIIFYSIYIFGVNWLLFNLFMPVIFELKLTDFILRSIGDTFFIFAGALFSEYFTRRRN